MGRMVFTESDVQRVLDHLRQRVETFKEIRRKFDIGEELGLASLPECHDYADGFIDEVVLKNGRPYIDFYYPTERLGTKRVESGEIFQNRMIVKPVFENGRAYLTSVYFSPGRLENKKGIGLDESFFRAPELILKGIFAHECAEYLWRAKREIIPRRVVRAFGEKFSFWYEHFKAYHEDVRRALAEQCPADFIASASGFKEEMIACLQFKKDRCLKWDDFPSNRYKRPQVFAAELQARIDFIKGAC